MHIPGEGMWKKQHEDIATNPEFHLDPHKSNDETKEEGPVRELVEEHGIMGAVHELLRRTNDNPNDVVARAQLAAFNKQLSVAQALIIQRSQH